MPRFLLLLFLLGGCGCTSENRRNPSRIELSPCQLKSPGSPARVSARCGTWRVFEDRGKSEGRHIDLRIAVVPAVSRSPEPDPLFFLAGGPGQAATESYVPVAPAFRRIRRDRDIVLVDQRGTGGSAALRCPESEEAEELWRLTGEKLRQWVERCLASLDADPRLYTTAIAMEDLDEVRDALGYETLNLYGVSYGTRAALWYLKRYPERVRTVILDGVVPPDETLGIDVARDAQRALDVMRSRCQRTPACAEAFPDLEASLDRLVSKLSKEPVRVTLEHPRTGEEETLALDRSMAAYALRLLSYSQETASLVPLLLKEADAGDLRPIAAQFLMTRGRVEESISDAMGFSVVCSEDFPFFDDETIAERARDTYLGAFQTDGLGMLCPHWPRGEIPENFKEPVQSDVPVMLLSGEADPVTPPENAESVAFHLENALHLVAGGQGHVVVHRGCIPSLVAELVETGEAPLDTTCVDGIRALDFFTSPAGPPP